jgi:hypothetical protein
VRIVLHAGLHKSGTTSIQGAWKRAYGRPSEVWYPPPPPGPPGHHRLTRPLVRAFVDGLAPDLAGASIAYAARDRAGRQSLADVVADAESRGVSTLLLSSELLDRTRPEDTAGLAAAFGGRDVTLVLTATRPVHRWCSGWQTLVKHGLAEYPADAAHHVLDFAALNPGRLRELTEILPATRTVVRLVRLSPPEPSLAADLAAALGLPPGATMPEAEVLNTSLGVDTEVVVRMNRADLALGADRAGLALLDRLRGGGFAYRDAPELAARYVLPDAVLEAAHDEQAWLGGLPALDPHGVLGSWTDPTVPGWYETISRREAVVPELDDAEDQPTLLWRARQERSAYRKLARRAAQRSEERHGADG